MPALQTIELHFLVFMTYSFLGWCMEVALKYREFGRFINRGFLIGPWLPIYGSGAILITLLLDRYLKDPLALFIMGMVVCSILEYSASWIMEKLFHARWWDYSKRKFNINGRICLETMVPFGIMGLIIMYVLNPIFYALYGKLSTVALMVTSLALFVGFIADLSVSSVILAQIRGDAKPLDKDNTEEMAAKVHEAIRSRSWAHRRVLDAFPNARHIGEVLKESAAEAIKAANEVREDLKESAAEAKQAAGELREDLMNTAAEIRESAQAKTAELRESLDARNAEQRERLEVSLKEYEGKDARKK